MLIKTNVYQLFNNYIGGLIEVSIKVVEIHEVVYKIYLINVLLLWIIQIIVQAGLIDKDLYNQIVNS